MTSGGTLSANPDDYAAAGGAGLPPFISSDALVAGGVPIEQLLNALGLSANFGDAADNGEAEKGNAERTEKTTDAATKFPANEEVTAREMQGVGEQGSQMAQQLPQMVGGLAGAISGALGGALQPLTQIPQQLAQTGQQLMQQGMGAMQKQGAEELSPEDFADAGLGDDFGAGGGGGEGAGEGGGGSGAGTSGGGIGGTSPTAMLGPPATPSATTTPTSARAMPPVPSAPVVPATGQMGGMGGMPMMPHGGMPGGGADGKADKADTKRVSVPSVKNGAPVQGRITAPPPMGPTVTKNVDGKPVATRRIVVPTDKVEEKVEGDENKGR